MMSYVTLAIEVIKHCKTNGSMNSDPDEWNSAIVQFILPVECNCAIVAYICNARICARFAIRFVHYSGVLLLLLSVTFVYL